MRKIDPQKLPDKVVLLKEQTEAVREIQQAVRTLNEDLISLAALQPFEAPQSANPDEWRESLSTAGKRLTDALGAIQKDLMLTEEGKAQLVSEWKRWHKLVAVHVNSIIRTLEKYAACEFVFCPETQSIAPSVRVEDVAEIQATRPVPEEAQDHARLLCCVHDAVLNLRQWEAEHNIRKIRLEELLNLDEQSLAEVWVSGAVFYPAFQSISSGNDARNKAVRQFNENLYV